MPLTLRWLGSMTRAVFGDDLRPETLIGPAAEVAKLRVPAGNESVELGDLFAIEGQGDGHLIFEGDLTHVRNLARGMTSGLVEIKGNAGDRLGEGMSGGSIVVDGSVGRWAGAEAKGGSIRVRGHAGDFLGASLPGSRSGMNGGLILVDGNAGDDVGLAMRRGLIAVGGRSGIGLGRGMIAGSIFAFGPVDRAAGAGMKRGTLALFGEEPELFPTFEPSGSYRPPFLTIYLRQLRQHGFNVPEAAFTAPVRRYNGDRLEGGRGEVMVVSTDSR